MNSFEQHGKRPGLVLILVGFDKAKYQDTTADGLHGLEHSDDARNEPTLPVSARVACPNCGHVLTTDDALDEVPWIEEYQSRG